MATANNVTGERMRLLRIERRMTQEEVGQRLGVSKATINKYELGTTQNLSRAKIETLASLFEVSPLYLMGWADTRDGSDLFTTYTNDQIFPRDTRLSYSTPRPNDPGPKPETSTDRQEKELLAVFRNLSVRGQTKLLSAAYEVQDSEQPFSFENLTGPKRLSTAEELAAFIRQITSAPEQEPPQPISEQDQKRVNEIIEQAKARIKKRELEKEKT